MDFQPEFWLVEYAFYAYGFTSAYSSSFPDAAIACFVVHQCQAVALLLGLKTYILCIVPVFQPIKLHRATNFTDQ